MLDAVMAAIERDRQRRVVENDFSQLRQRFETLSPREQEIMLHVTAGKMNKQVAGDLGISEIPVKTIVAPPCTKWAHEPMPISFAWLTLSSQALPGHRCKLDVRDRVFGDLFLLVGRVEDRRAVARTALYHLADRRYRPCP
jgi:hypothetical protein